jgi:hypothetical protein
MPSQVVYQTNADWHDSYEAMVRNPLVKVHDTQKGLLTFWFRGSQTVFMLASTGKLQVRWSDLQEKRMLYKLVKNLLVANPNEKLVIKPLRQQTWIEYPVPESFKLYWCDVETEFVLKKPLENKEEEKQDKSKSANKIFTRQMALMKEKEKMGTFGAESAKVRKAVEELRHEFRFFREPTLNEVALKSGYLDRRSLRIILDFMARWKNETLEDAKTTAEQAINLAGWLRFKARGELNHQLIVLTNKAIDAASMNTIEKAQVILKKYPELVPEVNVTGLIWPDETKIKWIQTFGSEPPAPRS